MKIHSPRMTDTEVHVVAGTKFAKKRKKEITPNINNNKP
jgi:hypothetical protein